MNSENKICQSCKSEFTIDSDDFAFYEKMQVPPPTFCPECRLIRRLAWRNERGLYKRNCDLCGESKILMYPAGSEYKVYCYPCWWSEKWDGATHAREYDFSRPFFVQFQELLKSVPRPGIIKQKNQVESEYTNRVTDMRNCYLLFGSTDDEFCRYGSWYNFCKECVDCYHIEKCERCYECIDCYGSSGLAFSDECTSCIDSWFLANCTNCQNCFGCVNLISKNYCIFNKQYSKEEYERMLASFNLGSAEAVAAIARKFAEFRAGFIVPNMVMHHSAGVSGNWIENSKNLRESFSATEVEEGKYLYSVFKAKEVMDYTFWGASAEQVYEAINTGIQVADVAFTNECWTGISNMRYAMNCHNSKNLFGCVGLRNAEYCILNKKYEPAEYHAMVEKIKEHMNAMSYVDGKGRSYGYGEFFPAELSPFAYNETIAQELFPLEATEAAERGFAWKDVEMKKYAITKKFSELPDRVEEVSESLSGDIVGCEHAGQCRDQCTTGFRILEEDVRMHKAAHLPLPRLCPNCRHAARLARRTPLVLWRRACMCGGIESVKRQAAGVYANVAEHFHGPAACPNEFETSYSPERPEIVYCKLCYQSEIA